MGFGAVLGQSRNAGSAPTTSTGKRTARFSIGTSTNGWTANDCDYLCDGTDDQVEINAAIQALPSGGGEIVILDGTYNISATISINKDNVTLSGNGNNTVLVRQWEAPSSGVISTFPVVYIRRRDNINISLLCIDGNSFSDGHNIGIHVYDSDNTKIKQCKFINNKTAITSTNSNSIEITDNYFLNSYDSISTEQNNSFFIIKGNFILNTSRYAIFFNYSSATKYVYQTNSVISDNLIDTANSGVYIYGSELIIANNIVTNCVDYGIRIYAVSSALGTLGNNNNISGNIIIKGSNAYSGYVGLSLNSDSQYNLVANNHLINGANISNQGTSNTVTNNIYN